MGFIISFVLFIMALGSYIKEKNVTVPEVMFNMVFSVVCFFSMFVYDEGNIKICNYVALYIYLIVFSGVISFNVGCFCLSNGKKINYQNEKIIEPIFKIFIILCFIGLLISCYASIKFILSGGMIIDVYKQSTNAAYIENEFYLPNFVKRFLIYIAYPLYFLLIPLLISRYFQENKIKYLFIASLFVLLKTISHFGRVDLLYFLLYFFILLINKYGEKIEINNSKNTNSKSKKFKKIFLYSFLLLGLIGFIFVLFVRNTNIIKTPINYFGTPLLYMQLLMNNVNKLGHTYGFLSFLGLWQAIMVPLKMFGLEMPEIFIFAQKYQYIIADGGYLPSAGIMYNAFSTIFYYFYVDYNWFGVIVIPFILGCLSKYIYNNFINGLSIKWAVNYLMISLVIVFSFIRCQFSRSEIVLAFVYTLFLFKRIKNIPKKNSAR